MGVLDLLFKRKTKTSALDQIGTMPLKEIWFAEYNPISDQWHMSSVKQMVAINYRRNLLGRDPGGYFPVFYGQRELVSEFIDEEMNKRDQRVSEPIDKTQDKAGTESVRERLLEIKQLIGALISNRSLTEEEAIALSKAFAILDQIYFRIVYKNPVDSSLQESQR